MSDEIKYENGEPSYTGNTVVKCFKDNGNGLLFRIENDDDMKWAFYNDTKKYIMKVTVVFGKTSEITPLGNTKMEKDEESGEYKCELEVGPVSTEMFVEGDPNGYKISFEAIPVKKAKKAAEAPEEKADDKAK